MRSKNEVSLEVKDGRKKQKNRVVYRTVEPAYQ